MDILSVRWSAKYGHFLRAEANVNALTYPAPPRTTVLGLLAAILGLEKDALATDLAEVRVAVSGAVPTRFWHRVLVRKKSPPLLPLEIKCNKNKKEIGITSEEKTMRWRQEWLYKPDYRLHIAWPEQPARFAEIVARIEQRRWHFTPCMGLSELLSEVEFLGCQPATPLPFGRYPVQGLCPADRAQLVAEETLVVHLLRLPRQVSANRVFSHAPYFLEHRGQAFTVETDCAWQTNNWTGLFL